MILFKNIPLKEYNEKTITHLINSLKNMKSNLLDYNILFLILKENTSTSVNNIAIKALLEFIGKKLPVAKNYLIAAGNEIKPGKKSVLSMINLCKHLFILLDSSSKDKYTLSSELMENVVETLLYYKSKNVKGENNVNYLKQL